MKVFRPARSLSLAWNVAKTLVQSSVLWLVFIVAVPTLIVNVETTYFPGCSWQGARCCGAIIFIFGMILNLAGGLTLAILGGGTPLPLDTARELVTKGPYRWVRNPIATGGIMVGIGVGVYTGSIAVVLYSLAGAGLWHFCIRPTEEADLSERFGAEYDIYRRKVGLWIPALTTPKGT